MKKYYYEEIINKTKRGYHYKVYERGCSVILAVFFELALVEEYVNFLNNDLKFCKCS